MYSRKTSGELFRSRHSNILEKSVVKHILNILLHGWSSNQLRKHTNRYSLIEQVAILT